MNNTILLTQSKTIYTFADKKTSAKDMLNTKRLLKKVYEYVAGFLDVETSPSSVSFLLEKKKKLQNYYV